MTLHEILRSIPRIWPLISSIKAAYLTTDAYQVSGINRFKQGITMLEEAGLFVSLIEKLKKTEIYKTTANELLLNFSQQQNILDSATKIEHGFVGLAEALSQILGEPSPDTIFIKLPDTNQLKEIAKYLSDFDKILSQTILHTDVGGTVEVKSVEPGSIWFEVCVGSLLAVSVVGRLYWAAAVISKKESENKMFEQHARSLSLKNDSLQELIKAQVQATQLMIESEAKLLYDHSYKTADPEQMERLKHAVVTMAELIQKGAEIQPSLSAPEQVTNLFPNVADLPLIESKVKKIENT